VGTLFKYLRVIFVAVLLVMTFNYCSQREAGTESQLAGQTTEMSVKQDAPAKTQTNKPVNQPDYAAFVKDYQSPDTKIIGVKIGKDGKITTAMKDGARPYITYLPAVGDDGLVSDLLAHNISVITEEPQGDGLGLGNIIMIAFVGVIIYSVYMQRKALGGGAGGAGAFGKAKVAESSSETCEERFDDIAGCDQAKEDTKVAISLLKDPKRFSRLGVTPPRGLLFVGPPGTGKTLFAKAIAGEAGVPFLSKGGPDFVEMYVGVGASRVRDFFKQAREKAPCILFIDEIDALGKKRGGAGSGNNGQEAEQTLNQLLIEMDGFDTSAGVILIGATNRPDVLDEGLTRAGRFDRHITLDLPDLKAREKVFAVHLRNKPCDDDVDVMSLAQGTTGMSPADIANICNEAGLLAGLAGKDSINMKDFEMAKDKILMGDERPTMIMTDEEKRMTAAHEAGHTIVGHLSPEHDPVYKVSIVPRTKSLGITMFLPPRDMISASRTKLESMLDSLYGGRIVEELVFGPAKVSTGASNDIMRATSLARRMVTEWGLSDLGPIAFVEEGGGAQYLGGRGMFQSHTSEATAQAIDNEVKKILDASYLRAETLIKANMKPLENLTEALLRWENIGVVQIKEIMEGKDLEEVTPPPGFSYVSAQKTEVVSDTE